MDNFVINKGETYTLDDVTYTAIEDAQLNLDDDNKVSGISSGSVQATVTGAANSPKVTFDATDGAFNFTAISDGKVIKITPFPIEFISGEFTYRSSIIDITAGSDLAIATERDGYSLRNENHFVTDSAYIFSSTALTSDSEHVISKFSLTNGTETRKLDLEQRGTVINSFAERGFTLVKGSSEILNIGDYKLTATAKDANAGLNVDLGEKGLTFVPNKNDGKLNVSLVRGNTKIFDGELECTNGSITLGYDHAVTFAKDTSFNFTTKNNTVLTVTANGEATTAIALTDNGITFTPGSNDGGLDISLSKKGEQVFEGSLNITDGTITFDTNTKNFSFSDGTKISLGIWNLELDIEVIGNTTVGSGIGANFKIAFDDNGNFIFTPDENGGSFNIALKRELPDNADIAEDVEAFFKNNITVNGPIMFNPQKGMLTLLDGSSVSLAFDEEKNYTLTATAQGDAASKISLTEEGISITPQQGDGTLKLALGSKNGSMSVDIEVLSGGFVFGENEALNVVEGTELQLTFSNEYSVKFKTTDKSGGSLKLSEDGITFTPNSGDGHLELTVTRGDETRTTSLEMTGSLTYKLDGSITLEKGTVLKNVFEDGNVLTITALTDASGSIIFHPAIGLQITPSTPDALNVVLTSGDIDVFNITSIDGSVYYKGGVITASDGTEARFTNYYMDSEMLLKTDGGFSSLEITEDSTSYIANEGATFTLDYQDKTTLEITDGKFIDDYEHAIVTAGSTFKTNDDEDYFYLETAGDYNLNGMNVTTTADNTKVILSDYKTITVDSVSYTALDDNAKINLDDEGKVSGIASGKVQATVAGLEDSPIVTFDATDSAIDFSATSDGKKLTVKTDSTFEFISGEFTYKGDTTTSAATDTMKKFFNVLKLYSDDTTTDGIAILDHAIRESTPFNSLSDAINHFVSDMASVTEAEGAEQSLLQNCGIILGANKDFTADTGAVSGYNAGSGVVLDAQDIVPEDDVNLSELSLPEAGSVKTYTYTGEDGKTFSFNVAYPSDYNFLIDFEKFGNLADYLATEEPDISDDDDSEDDSGDSLSIKELEEVHSFIDKGLKEVSSVDLTEEQDFRLNYFPNNPVASSQIRESLQNIIRGMDNYWYIAAAKLAYDSFGIDFNNKTLFPYLEINDSGLASTTALDATGTGTPANIILMLINAESYGLIDPEDTNGNNNLGNNFPEVYLDRVIAHEMIHAIMYANGLIKNNMPAFFTEGVAELVHGADDFGSYKNFEILDLAKDNERLANALSLESGTGINDAYPAGHMFLRYLCQQSLSYDDSVLSVSDGSILKSDDEEISFILETKGDYNLNSMNVTTTAGNTPVLLSNYDTITIDGISYTPQDDNVVLTIDGDVVTCAGGKVSVLMEETDIPLEVDTTDGSLTFDSTTNKFSFAEGAILSLQTGSSTLQFVAKEDFSIGVEKTADDKVSFNLDGTAQLEIVNGTRTTTLDFTGGIVYESGGKISLEDGTEINLTWEDGNTLKLTSHGSNGSILLDADKGVQITSDDENLDMTLTTAEGYSTTISSIKGSLWYKSGTVTLDADTFITGKNTVEGHELGIKFEAIGGTGSLKFANAGFTYSAGTGKNKVTYTLGKAVSSFTVNKGSVFIQNRVFHISKGSDVSTDFKDFIPAQYFETGKAGTYTINGQTITTTAANLALTATDDYMAFKTSDDVVEYDGMTFAGNGNVSLKPDIVVLGKDVVATGFSEGNSFMLAEAGNVTADAKVFELTEQENKLGEEIPLNVSVEGAQDGFIFSRTITRESEDYFDDPDYDNVGKIFTEKFIVHNDETYRTRTDPLGLQEVIGISGGASIEGGAILGDEVSPSYYDLVTDTNGDFTIGENTYKIADDTEVGVVLNAAFEDGLSYASAVKNLNGTISGNFSDGGFAVNGNASLNVYEDEEISIIGSGKKYEILGLDENASLKVSAADNYSVNGKEIVARAGDIIVGTSDGEAEIYYANTINNTVNNTLITGTENSDYIINSGTGVTIQALGDNDYIENNVDSTLVAEELANSIDAGAGNDVIYSYHTYNPTLLGGEGDDSIVVENGHKTFADGGAGNDTIIGVSKEGGWGMGDYATVLGGEGDDYINPIYSKEASINGGDGNDTILVNGENATVDGGAGKNLIISTDAEGGVKGKFIVLNGNTTVENFNTGFDEDLDPEMGEGTDTVYITGESPAVDFKDEGLTLYYDDDPEKSLTFSDINNTTKLNLYYEASLKPVSEVFIADDEWYKVTENDLSTMDDSELRFVGATAKKNHGIDFSGIESDLNVSLLGHNYPEEVENLLINNIHSIKGGAGNMTITGSDKSDTIISGTGDTTINAAGGDDLISLSGGAALIQYSTGDGNDTIYGFNSNATLSPDSAYTTQVSGDDLIVNVGNSKITLKDAANLPYPNISSSHPIVQLAETILKRTALGYPAMAAAVFDPEGNYGDEPTNYSDKEDWTITSKDKLKLHAVHYTPENSNDKWVVLIHGYGNNHTAMYTYAESYLANDYNVLMIDQRAAGESEGTWLTMGAAESEDVALWTREIARRNSKAKITLHGVSMGAATAMLAAARSDTKNVTSIVEDCGYSDVMETFSTIIANSPQLAEQGIVPEVVPALDPYAAALTGYPLTAAAPIDSISSVKKPSLFISGDADSVAPVTMLDELYDASGAKVKEKFIVEGSKHALAVFDDSINYNNAVFRFVAEADGEGWATTNTTDGISLSGTKYNDTLANSGDDVTINGGKGDDLISLSSDAKENVIEYFEGDGNDTIYGFNSTDMLSISGADFTAHKSGDDIILTVDKGNITLADAVSLSSTLDIVNQKGVTSDLIINSTDNTLVAGTDEDDYIINSGTTVTIQGYGGNDYIENNVDSSLTAASLGNSIDAGDGNDTIYNYHSYNPTLLGGAGNDSIVVTRGHLTYVDGGAGNDSIIGKKDSGGWDMGGYATVKGGAGNDYINTGYTNSASIDGEGGNDTIFASGNNITINGGAGKNLIKVLPSSLDANNDCAYIVFSGDTTVEGFKTGFGNGSDTIYIPGNPAAVDFKSGGLTFYGENDSLILNDVHTTAKVNLFHESRDVLNKGVFIAEGDWYKVAESDLTVNAGEEVYFVGPSASPNRGVDFSGIESDLNVTIDTAYIDSEDYVPTSMWINGVYSIKGGAGLTTITGSKNSDTIIGGTGETTINGKGGDDLIKVGSGAALIEYAFGDGNDSIVGFKANSTLSISGGKYTSELSGDDLILTVGDDKVTIFGASSANIIGQRDIPVEELQAMFGDKLTVASGSVELGDDGAAVAVYEEDSEVDIQGGAGNDTLIALGSAPITFDMSAGGADKIYLTSANQKVTLEGYNASQGGGIATGNPNTASMVEEIMAGKDTRFGNGSVSVKTSEETQSVFTFDSPIINFFDANNRILPVGFTNSNGGTLDVSNSDDDYLLIGNYFGEKRGGSTLISGNGNDTLLGGDSDLLDAAGGINQIYLAGSGAKIALDNGGRTAVHNFQTGFDGDALYSKGDIATRIRFDGENITASVNGGAQVTLESVANDADFAELLMYEGEDLTKVAVAKPGGTIKSNSADIYIGRENAGVDFSGMTDDLLVNLSDEPVVTGSNQKQFFGISQVTAGDGNSTLIGTSGNETLTAGTGNTSIWGGAGYDSLIGKGGSADKTGSTTFFFEPGDGRDIIKDFEFLTAENLDTSDKIDIGDNVIKDASISRGKVFIDFEDNSRLIIRDAVGKDFRIGDLIAKVDNNISYDGLANCYVASGGSSLTVDSNVESAEIWLDNSHGTLFFGNIRTLDASAVKGNTSLVGNEFNNTIIGGKGDSSLWGGSSTSDDVLIGGAGKNTFFYLQGDGRDTVQNIHDGDDIILDNINLDQILDANISANGVVLNFNDGGSLTINGTADVTYQLADGSKYCANHEQLEWTDR